MYARLLVIRPETPHLPPIATRDTDMLMLTVTGMSCDHCVRAVTRAVRGVPGAGPVAVDLDRGTVAVHGDPDPQAVRAAIAGEGYGIAA
jgi:copper chaperone